MTTMEYQETQDTEPDHDNDAQPRAARRAAPNWQNLLKDRHNRRLIASQLAIRVEALRADDELGGRTAAQEANDDLAELCQEVSAALRSDPRR